MIYTLPGNHRNNGEKLSSSTMEVKRQFATNKIGVPMSHSHPYPPKHTHPYTPASTKADRVAIKKNTPEVIYLMKYKVRNCPQLFSFSLIRLIDDNFLSRCKLS